MSAAAERRKEIKWKAEDEAFAAMEREGCFGLSADFWNDFRVGIARFRAEEKVEGRGPLLIQHREAKSLEKSLKKHGCPPAQVEFTKEALIRESEILHEEYRKRRRALWQDVREPLLIGAVVGGCAAMAAAWIGGLPAWTPTGYVAWTIFGVIVGGYVAARPALLRHNPFDFEDDDVGELWEAGAFGALVGGSIAFGCTAAWFLVVHGSYDAWANIVAFVPSAVIGGIVNAWRRCIELKVYPRVRFTIGIVLAGAIGAAVAIASLGLALENQSPFIEFYRAVAQKFPVVVEERGLLARLVTAIGVVLGAGIYLLARWGRRPRMSRRSARPRVSARSVGDAFFEAGDKVAAFVRGLVYIGAGVGFGLVDLWWGNSAPTTGGFFGPVIDNSLVDIWRIGELIFYVCAAILVFMGLRELRTAFKGRPRLRNEGAHGSAGDAGPEDAQRAMGGGRSPVDDRAF